MLCMVFFFSYGPEVMKFDPPLVIRPPFFYQLVTVLRGSTVVTYDLFYSIRLLFHKNCGQFISLDSNRTTARRVDSYNHGVVLSEKPLPDNHLFQVS